GHTLRGGPHPPGKPRLIGPLLFPQLGLLVDLSPDGLMIPEDGVNHEELEAEFLALVGDQPPALEKLRGKGPLPMEAIEKMARLCLRDPDEEEEEEGTDDDDVEADDALLVSAEPGEASPWPHPAAACPPWLSPTGGAERGPRGRREGARAPATCGPGTAPSSPPRPESRLTGGLFSHVAWQATGTSVPKSSLWRPCPLPSWVGGWRGDVCRFQEGSRGSRGGSPPRLCPAPRRRSPRVPRESPPASAPALAPGSATPQLPPGRPWAGPGSTWGGQVPPPPQTLLEALEQRMERYHVAATQAKAKGDQRKARMHERIVKVPQARAPQVGTRVHPTHCVSAGRAGFPPIQGLEASEPAQQSLVGVLETAMKLASQDEGPEDEEDEALRKQDGSSAPVAQPKAPPPRALQSGSAPTAKAAPKATSTRAQQQLAFLEGRKKQLLQAALRAKQKNDVEGAKMHLRQAKGLEPMLEASRNGLPVDIAKVPPAPVNKDDFVLVQRPGPGLSPEAARRYGELTKLIRQQHEMCLNHSNQFTHLGNIAEASKFEKLAEGCKQSMETLKQAFARGLPTPAARFEQRTFNIIKIFSDLSSSDMLLFIVKGVNLPTPPGLSPGDLDIFVRFDFPYPNVEEAQKDKTSVVRNTDSPEIQEQFKLSINRGHRGFRRAIQTKGIKFEVVHKGGLFKTDRVLGTAQLKLDTLETACEVREILEVLDGRRPTGGRLEVMVRIREPLTTQQLETTTERWLVIDPVPAAVPTQVTGPKGRAPPIPAPSREPGNRSARPLPSLCVLAFDQERLERKILALRQARRAGAPPGGPEVAQQYQDIVQSSQWQRAQLEQGGASLRREYAAHLERQLQFYTEAARRLGNDGRRGGPHTGNLEASELQPALQALPW
uniref:Coiled-coil and C2 domain-containing protein 1A n=1 Tax=Spermophilus dauricus TaxID=99837 RepID=A0A8C9PIU5_SPEDA